MIHKFEEYPELADLMQEYACNGRFGDWQKFTDALNNALTKAENLPISDVRSSHIEDIRKELEVFFASRKVSHRTIKKFELEKSAGLGINIIPREPYFEESYEDEDADILIEAIGKKYGVNGLGWVYWVYPK